MRTTASSARRRRAARIVVVPQSALHMHEHVLHPAGVVAGRCTIVARECAGCVMKGARDTRRALGYSRVTPRAVRTAALVAFDTQYRLLHRRSFFLQESQVKSSQVKSSQVNLISPKCGAFRSRVSVRPARGQTSGGANTKKRKRARPENLRWTCGVHLHAP